jgi:gamma-glutamyltranspeptidase/glutathione hydrolase
MSGGLPVGVPGTIAAMSKLHARFGALPLEQVLAPAIALAESGFPVSPDLARALKSEAKRLKRFPASRALFFHPDGRPNAEGERMRNPELAACLRLWAADPTGRFFYQGPVAKAVVETVRRAPFQPGFLSLEDLAAYKAVYRDPIFGSYRARRLAVFPPPSSGGITLLEILGLMETRPRPERAIDDDGELLDFLDAYARASRVAFADRDRHLGDADWRPEIPMWSLSDPDFVDARALEAFQGEGDLATPAQAGSLEGFHTTHFAAVDALGNMISVTSTIETTCGSAMVVPGYGFLLNNELTDFNLIPSDPAAPNDIDPARRPRSSALDNEPGEGGKRPRSSMCPVIAYDDRGVPDLALGSPGGPTIIGTVAQVLMLMIDYDLFLPKALAHPRLYSRNLPLEIETYGWNWELLADSLRGRGWEIAPLEYFPVLKGDVQAVSVMTRPGEMNARQGASDPRGDGRPSGS